MDLTSVTQARYFGGDAETIKQEIIDDLRQLFGADWTNYYASSMGMILTHIEARAAARVAFAQNRAASDSFAKLVRVRRYASLLAQQLGYNPRGATAATAVIAVELSTTYAFDVPIPAYFQFKAKNGTKWYTDAEYTWPASTTAVKSISLLEGERKTVSFVSDGTANQKFTLGGVDPANGYFLKDGSVEVVIGGAAWTAANPLSYTGANEYEIWYAVEPPLLIFGDAMSANVPSSGSTISVTYVVTRGPAGNVPAAQIDSVVSPLVVLGTTISLTISQPNKSEGGLGLQTVGDMMTTAVGVFKSRGRAIVASDFEALSLAFASTRYGSPAAAQAIAPRGAGNDLELANGLQGVRTVIGTPATTTAAALAILDAKLLAIDAARTALNTLGTTMSSSAGLLDVLIDAADASLVSSDGESIKALGFVQAAQTQITAIATAGSDQLQVSTKNAILALLASAVTDTGDARTHIASARTYLQNLLNSAEILVDTADDMVALTNGTSDFENDVDVCQAQSTAIAAAVVTVYDSLEPALQAIYDHVDSILAHDAKANVIQVAILARDSDGFYTAASVGLRASLRDYLATVSEPTVSIEVVDGSTRIITPAIKVTGKYTKGLQESVVEAALTTRLYAALKVVSFEESLYLRIMYQTCDIPEMTVVNVSFTGPAEFLDSSGNLIVPEDRVAGKPTITFDLQEA